MPEQLPVVSNTGPLIALAGVGRADLLGQLYGEVWVPDTVLKELAVGEGRPGSEEQVTTAQWIRRVELDLPPDLLLTEELGAGEAAAIAVASRHDARLLLMDDRKGRRVAELAYRLRVRGVAGILVEAKRKGMISLIRPSLEAIREHGYYLGQRVIDRACREADE